MKSAPAVVVLGGFLGAGKTTLILAASRLLQARGLRAAAILNDQGSELVDAQYVRQNGIDADQVSSGCFCCRFSDLIDAAERLAAHAPAVIFAEAVGSCADISATTLQPLKLFYKEQFRLALYTVVVDPARLSEISAAPESDLSFLFRKQIEEGDLVCMTKSDLHPDCPPMPGVAVRYISALTGGGVSAWLDEVLDAHQQVGGKILEIDYERYARAEAGLAWLNCRVSVKLDDALSPSSLVGPLLEALDGRLTAHKIAIAHLKVMDECEGGYVKASVVRNGEEPNVQGMLDASPAADHELLLNLRAMAEPGALQHLVQGELFRLPGSVTIQTMQCFSPAAPKPEHRMSSVVSQS